ncbi:unnamed protein product [Phytophthora lilii]|uniref:Unnamed protein product n=1 Tax=Phytophthora lilii TaxID=2077276 RepID=A0A9W7CS51_9STRA|nr:unnamed protein product [Phytophthora lilii]
MGLRRSGKSSIQRVVFHKMSPHETLFLEGTNSLDIKYIANNSFVQFQIWDFPGDYDFKEMIFSNCGSIVFVIDAQDEPYAEALARLHDTVTRAHRYNPDILFEVFIHKVDGDLFLSDDHKIGCPEADSSIADFGEPSQHSHHGTFKLITACYRGSVADTPRDQSSDCISVIQGCNMEKSFLFDVVSKVYIATDSNPVDMQSYELCSDMIDVVIDVSCIYG